jgi:hypothetical protein
VKSGVLKPFGWPVRWQRPWTGGNGRTAMMDDD